MHVCAYNTSPSQECMDVLHFIEQCGITQKVKNENVPALIIIKQDGKFKLENLIKFYKNELFTFEQDPGITKTE